MNNEHFSVMEVDPDNELDAVIRMERGYFRGVLFRITEFDFSAIDEGIPEIKFEIEVIKDSKKKTLKWEKFRGVVDTLMHFLLSSYAEMIKNQEEGEHENE